MGATKTEPWVHTHKSYVDEGYRRWWHFRGCRSIELHSVWCLNLGFRFSFNDEGLDIRLGFIIFALYLNLQFNWVSKVYRWLSKSKKSRYDAGSRDFELSIGNRSVQFSFYHDDTGMSDVKGYRWYYYWDHIVQKRFETKPVVNQTVTTEIEYDGEKVNGHFKVEVEELHSQKRLFGKIKLESYKKDGHRINVELLSHRLMRLGKGENSWDCDDDFTTSISFHSEDNTVKNLNEYIDYFMKDAKKSLTNRGSVSGKSIIEVESI